MSNIKQTLVEYRGDECEVHVVGLTRAELDLFLGFLNRMQRVELSKDFRLKATCVFDKPPGPVEDPVLAGYWPVKPPPQQLKLLKYDEIPEWSTPSFIIQHLGAMSDKYKEEVEKALSYGFVPLRSQRGDDGLYWELWYLSSIWCAEGELKETLEKAKYKDKKDNERVQVVVSFLASHLRFGTLNVSIQKLGLCLD